MQSSIDAGAKRLVSGSAAMAAYAARAVPRYTSYPTAPHFHSGVTGETYRNWLQALPVDQPVSIYLHTPFCGRVCWYCACNMKLAARYEPIAAYVEGLLAEIDLLAQAAPGRLSVSHLHWGGGSPTTLRPDDLERVMARIAERFRILPQAELAIEADPRGLTDAMVERLGALGFTRASFGVQEFDPEVQKAINRVQPPELVADRLAALRAAGVSAINFDLLYGLPLQTRDALVRSAETCLSMTPDRVALFGYAHVPWMAKRQRLIDTAQLPNGEARAAQEAAARVTFTSGGYRAIGLDHFAQPGDPLTLAAERGRLRRNFQGYSTDMASALLGIGATSISRTPSGYVQNHAETGAWAREIALGRLPVAKGAALNADALLRGYVIERLLCLESVDLDLAGARFGASVDWWAAEAPELRRLERDGLLRLKKGRLSVTPAGRPLARVIAAAFDRYLERGPGRHSRAL